MKTALASVSLIALLCFFTSCFDRPDYSVSTYTTEVVFSAAISSYSTRTTQDGSGWTTGDAIGVYMIDDDTEEVESSANNLRYSCTVDDDSDGATTVTFSSSAAPDLPDYNVRFTAYYPYTTAVTGTTYPVRIADQSEGTTDYDLMYAATTDTYDSNTDGEIPLAFYHQLCHLVFQFLNVNEETIYANNVSITGMNTAAYFNLMTGELYDEGTNTRLWCYVNDDEGQCEALVLPADIDDTHTLNLYVEKEFYSWPFSDADADFSTMEAGHVYTITLAIDTESTGISYVGIDDDGGTTGQPWTLGGNTNGVASAVGYELFPASESTDAYRDTELIITFDADRGTPTVGTEGTIRVYRQSDGQLCDSINLADESDPIDNTPLHTKMDIIGQTPAGYSKDIRRVVNYYPVLVYDNQVVIKLHSNKLDYDTGYYVEIDEECIDHKDFKGIDSSGEWTFHTRAEIEAPTDDAHTVTVSHNAADDADFYTVQGAIDYLVSNFEEAYQKTVYVYNGTYEEMLFVAETGLITIEGESQDGTIIEYNNYNNFNGGTGSYQKSITEDAEYGTVITASGGRSVFLIYGMEKVCLKNLTINNSSGANGQAEAISLRYGVSTKCINCNFFGYQDTLYLGDTYCLLYNCLVTGAVDFIWGAPDIALLQNCELRMVGGGEMFQPRSGEYVMGFVAMDCSLTYTEGATFTTNLVRTFGSAGDLAFIRCTAMDNYFTNDGWGDTEPSVGSAATYGFRYYQLTDTSGQELDMPAADLAYALSAEEVATYYDSRATLFAAYGDEGVAWFDEN